MAPRRMDRRDFLKKGALGGASFLALYLAGCAPAAAPTPAPAVKPAPTPTPIPPPTPTPESPAARAARLYEAAKREGKVMLYSTGTAKEADDYKKPFEAKYPGVTVEYFTGTSEDITNRITAEARAGKMVADLFVMTFGGGWLPLLKEGLVAKLDSPELRNFPKEAYDPEGRYVHEQHSIYIMAYNTKLVPEAEAPKAYADLINPKWKGKIVAEVEAYEWFVHMIEVMGRDKAIAFMKQLAPLVQLRKGHTTLVELVIAGEFAIAATAYQHRVQGDMEKGAPVKWVAPKPTFAFPRSAGITKDAPHANAARLFLDWRLTEEGQKITVKQRRIPTRIGAKADPPSLTEGIEFFIGGPKVWEQLEKEQKTFRDIFGAI